MPYTIEKPPEWLKNLPKGAIKIGVDTFNAVLAGSNDDDKARKAAWAAIKAKYEKGKDGIWRAKSDVSLDEIRDMLWEALDERDTEADLHSVYGGYIIYEKAKKYYRLPYSILEGKVQFGTDAMEVERVWVEARSQQNEYDDSIEMRLRLGDAQDPEGNAWEVTICEPGFTKNGWYLPEDALREAAGLFEGVDVNIYELPTRGATHVPDALFDIKSLLVKNKAGWLENVRYVAGEGLKAVLHFMDSFKWLGKNLKDAISKGAKAYGLSYDAPVRAKKAEINGKPVMELVKFLAVDSVDIVTRPAAGGRFNRAIAAQKKEEIMDKKQLWELISKARPDLLKGKEFDSVTDEEMIALARMAMEPGGDQGGDGEGPGDGAAPGDTNNQDLVTRVDLEKFRCEMALNKALDASDLPDAAKDRIRTTFSGRVFQKEELDRAIADEKDYIAKMAQSQDRDDESIPSHSIISGGLGTLERAQMAVDRMFGLTKEDMEAFARLERLDRRPFFEDMRSVQDYHEYDQVPAFSSLREMYVFFTGDHEVTGRFMRKNLAPDLCAKMDITSATFSYVLGNTMGRRLVREYRAVDYGENILLSIKKPVRDFRQQEAVMVGFFPDLADVDPETADYEEIASVTDEESTYTVGQKGNILTISRKTIINDDLSLIQRLVSRLGRAARRTHAKYVLNFFINNATCSDGTAWFTAGHGNLGSSDLSIATALAAYKALGKATEKDSGERIGLLDDPSVKPVILHPIDLVDAAQSVAYDEFYYTSNDLTTKTRNPLKDKVKVQQCSLLVDTKDWGMIMPADVVDIVEMGYLNGREEPEMFVADSPQAGQVFVADKVRHKIRHEYAGALIDYRGGYKAVVT